MASTDTRLGASVAAAALVVVAMAACNVITGVDGYRNVDGDASDAGDARAADACAPSCLIMATSCGDKCRSDEATCEGACSNQGCINKCKSDESTCLGVCQSACTGCSCAASACSGAVAGGE